MKVRTLLTLAALCLISLTIVSASAVQQTVTFSVSAPVSNLIASITPTCSAGGLGTVASPCALSDTAGGGTPIASIAVAMSVGSFTGTLQLVTNGGSCSNGDNTHFQIAGNNTLASASSTPPTVDNTYVTCIQAVQSAASNSPQTAQVNILVSAQQALSSPQIVNLTATPSALLSSTGNYDGQLSTTCLGPCPGTPSYVLNTPTTGSCTSNNNGEFSLTPQGHLTTPSPVPSYGYVCIAVNMTGATNTGITFPVYIPAVASSTIYNVTVSSAYFAAGTVFSGNLAVTCQNGPYGWGFVNAASMCTGVPTYALDNTPGDCPQANNTGPAGTSPTFALSGATLSLTAPQTVVGNYYACVTVNMLGATASHWQLVATITHGRTDTPVAMNLGIWPDPPNYMPGSPYTGKLVAYCTGSVTGTIMNCGASPSFSPQTSCGGQNNINFTLSGPGNSIITSTGALAAGGQYPCVASNIPGVPGATAGQYAILYPATSSTLSGIAVQPWYYTAAAGSMSGQLKALCSEQVCTGTPSYAPSTACANGGSDNHLAALSGSTLTVTTTTPNTYNPCIAVSMTGASNSGAAFEVPVTASATASNCPATPPPQAVAAGFTQLVYCLDPSQSLYSNVYNWVNCAPTVLAYTTNQFWGVGGAELGVDCGVSESHPFVTQVVDPTTGKTVLDVHWDGYADTNWSASGGQADYHTLSTPHDFPTALYAEYRIRMVPDHGVSFYNGQCCAPDFWTFISTSDAPYPPGCVKYDPTNYCWNYGSEIDIIESFGGATLLDAVHYIAMPTDANGNPQCCASGQDFFVTDESHTSETWNANMPPDPIPFHNYTSWGARFATDGTATFQVCYYWDEVLVQAYTKSGSPRFGPACQYADYTGLPSLAYVLRHRHQFNFWFSGGWAANSVLCQSSTRVINSQTDTCASRGDQGLANQDTYIEYVAIWACPNWNKYNEGNGYDSQPPCPVSNPYPTP